MKKRAIDILLWLPAIFLVYVFVRQGFAKFDAQSGWARAFAVYLTIENPGDQKWRGNLGADAEVRDLTDAVFPAVRPGPERRFGNW